MELIGKRKLENGEREDGGRKNKCTVYMYKSVKEQNFLITIMIILTLKDRHTHFYIKLFWTDELTYKPVEKNKGTIINFNLHATKQINVKC